MTYAMTCVGYWYFCTVLLTLWFLSLNKRKQQKQMFVAEVFKTTMHCRTLSHSPGNGGCFPHGVQRLHLSLRTWSLAAQLKRSAHFVQRNWHRSPHDLQIELNVVPGHWFSPKKVVILWVRALTIREKAFECCCCCCWWPHGVLICNSWLLKSNNRHQSETLHSNVTLFRLF